MMFVGVAVEIAAPLMVLPMRPKTLTSTMNHRPLRCQVPTLGDPRTNGWTRFMVAVIG